MIFFAYASPTPGSASSSAWDAVLRSTSAGLTGGLVSLGAILVAGGLLAVWARPIAGASSSEAASASPPRICLKDMVLLWVRRVIGSAVTTTAFRPAFNRHGSSNQIFTNRLRARSLDAPAALGLVQPSALTASTTASTWPLTVTLGQCCLTLPSLPMSTVERMMPFIFLPYITLSPHAP